MIHVISGVGEALKLRGDTLSLFRLSDILKRKSDITDSSKGTILIVRNHKGVFSVMVDDIIRQQQVVIKKIGDEIKNRKGLMGSAILGDGKPALIVDLTDLINVKSRDRTSSETIQKGVAA
jgi:two-component system chemotaxis sensor kinase CheA